jgi:hypothetical protein
MNNEQPISQHSAPRDDQSSSSQGKNKKWPKIALVALVILAIIFGGYYWCSTQQKNQEKQKNDQIAKLEAEKAQLTKDLEAEIAKHSTHDGQTDQSACTAPTASTIQNIKDSITSGNTSALEGYMAPKVTVILAASEGLGERTSTQAVADITNFVGAPSEGWDFSLPSATITTFKGGFYKQYFPEGVVVGKSADNKIIAFSFDCQGKIKTVFMATDASQL